MTNYPKTPGALADKFYRLKNEIAEIKSELSKTSLAKKLDKKEKEYKEFEQHIIKEMKNNKLEGMSGKTVNLTKTISKKASVSDGEALRDYVLKTGNTQIFQKTLVQSEIKEILEAGEIIPGIQFYNVEKISVRKR